MYLNLITRKSSKIPYLTLGLLVQLSTNPIQSMDLKVTDKFSHCAEMRFRIIQNFKVYQNLIEKSADERGELDTEWSKVMLDIDWDNLIPMRYPHEVDESLKVILDTKSNNIQSLILLCSSLGINLEYINKDTDQVQVSDKYPYCTKRMVKYFPNQLIKISRSEYRRLRKIDKWLAIKSGNYFYKNKTLDEALFCNSMS